MGSSYMRTTALLREENDPKFWEQNNMNELEKSRLEHPGLIHVQKWACPVTDHTEAK